MPSLHRGGQGSLLVKMVVEIPKSLSKRQRELIKEFAEQDQPRNIFDRIKEAF
jgi:DnaJ-class molecular chaperone